ncbi:hydrogenase formation protein HypD [Selenomonas sp.]|uniref:hydrogenase formation protein HypD n=1 Tax=Selenomonas sp. TaxID=2053611 RepID=UPI003FA28598
MKKLTSAEEKKAAKALLADIERLAEGRHLRYMEVCGTHTVAIFRAGLRQILPENIELVSGPGCPVCVTSDVYMDKAIAYAKMESVTVATFGDMLKVPGSRESLADARAAGADIRVVYSPLDALTAARENPQKTVVFLGVGFETTAPTEAAAVLSAKDEGLQNFCVLSAQKLVPPAVKLLLDAPDVHVDGFLLPGHACVVTGTRPYAFLADEAHKPGVVAGFTPLAILRAVWRLVRQTADGDARIENEYGSVVREEGNPAALAILARVYEDAADEWRGLGVIERSGLCMREAFADFDAERRLPVEVERVEKKTACRCGEVLRGAVRPTDCTLFAKACVPTHAVGPCMVSVEGVCAAWYKYGRGRFHFGK